MHISCQQNLRKVFQKSETKKKLPKWYSKYFRLISWKQADNAIAKNTRKKTPDKQYPEHKTDTYNKNSGDS